MYAIMYNTAGTKNVALGYEAGFCNTTANDNTGARLLCGTLRYNTADMVM